MRRNQIPSLDGIRALSIAFVVFGHTIFALHGSVPHPFSVFSSELAYLGVQIFFVLSGFLITSLFLEEKRNTEGIDVGAFFRRRFFRIVPAAVAYIVVAGILYSSSVQTYQILVALTFTSSYFIDVLPSSLLHLWSVSVEEQFYLFYPFVVKAGRQGAIYICLSSIVLCPFIRLWCLRHHYLHIEFYFPTVLDSLSVGCLVGFYRGKMWSFLRRCDERFLAFGGVTAALFLLYLFGKLPLLGLWMSSAVAGCAGIFLLTSIESQFTILNLPLVSWLGKLSYSIYLWQQLLIFHTSKPPMTHLVAGLLALLPVAACSYYLIEKPLFKLKVAAPYSIPRTCGEVVPTNSLTEIG